MNKWSKVKNFQDLQNHMVEFLNGKRKSTPWFASSVLPETVPLLGNMKKINQLGFVTTDSQPTVNLKDHKQRAYIEGLINDKKVLTKLIKNVSKNRDKIFLYILDMKTGKIKQIGRKNCPNSFYWSDEEGTYISLTETLDNKEWLSITNFPISDKKAIYDSMIITTQMTDKIKKIVQNSYYIKIIMKDETNEKLDELIIKWLSSPIIT